MLVYYNEVDAYLCAWLRNLMVAGLIPAGDIDQRDIREVAPTDIAGYQQAHFFAGLGGWAYAAKLAGWGGPVWTGSCPCQPFSSAGKRKGFADDRDLWPAWHRLIAELEPPIVFGEQVASATAWLDRAANDLEAQGYAVGAAVLPACSVGAPHIRQRIWFVANASSSVIREQSRRCDGASWPREAQPGINGQEQPLADADSERLSLPRQEILSGEGRGQEGRTASLRGWWAVEPDVGRVAHGIPARVPKLRALGNAIVPQVASEFIQAAKQAIGGINGREDNHRALEDA